MISDTDNHLCRVCGSSDFSYKYTVNACDIVICNQCHFIQLLGTPSAELLAEIYGADYFQHGKYVDDFAIQHEQNRRLTLLQNSLALPGGHVLDYGCATGDFVNISAQHFTAYGTDYSRNALAMAKNTYPKLAEYFFDIDNTGTYSGKFDAITMWDVIEHLSSPKETLNEIRTLLRDEGVLLLSTPNIGAIIAKLMKRRWAFMTPPEHMGFFTKATLNKLLSNCGFEPLHWSTKGKYVNAGFLVYKLKRVFPEFIPQKLVDYITRSKMGEKCVYIPTGDIQYAIYKKVNRTVK